MTKLRRLDTPEGWIADRFIAVDWHDGPVEGALSAKLGCAWFRLLDERIGADGPNRRLFGLGRISNADFSALVAACQFLQPASELHALAWRPDGSSEWHRLESVIARLETTSRRVALIVCTNDFSEVDAAWMVEGKPDEEAWTTLLDEE